MSVYCLILASLRSVGGSAPCREARVFLSIPTRLANAPQLLRDAVIRARDDSSALSLLRIAECWPPLR
jgi:hypothetical protein